MESQNLPATVLLHHSDNGYAHHLKRILKNLKIEILEISHLAEIQDKSVLESIPLCLAIIDPDDISGLDFLRAVMHSNNWIQRILLTPQIDMEVLEIAVNKSHINYLLQLPVPVKKFETFLRKAMRRFEEITKPFSKFDALASVTEELLEENEKMRLEATMDPLTKVMNRRSFNRILENVWKRYKEKGIPFSLAILDLDFFKKVNDTYGHQTGDVVLQKIAEILQNNQRIGIDYAFRYGGEEFAILSSNTSGQEMQKYLQRLLKITGETVIVHNKSEIQVTFSAGVCQVDDKTKPEMLISNADEALYKAKNNGRNQIVLFKD